MKNSNQVTIFIIDDDKLLTGVLKNELVKDFPQEDIVISVFEAGEQCELFLKEKPDIAIVDFHMNSKYRDAMNGIRIIDMIRTKSAGTEIIMFTREENAEVAMRALRHGAHDYIIKNDYMFQRLNVAMQQCIKLREIKRDLRIQKNRGLFAVIIMVVLLGLATTIQFFATHGL
jgi:DNA-binding NarL/FixJ family response regulator